MESLGREFVKRIREGIIRPEEVVSVFGTHFALKRLFISPADQVRNVLMWNRYYRLGFSDEDFRSLPEAPRLPTEELHTVVLVPYLEDAGQTFQELWKIADRWERRARKLPCWVTMTAEFLGVIQGCDHSPGLRWEVIDLSTYWNRSDRWQTVPPIDPSLRCHAGLMAAAAHFPAWIRNMDGEQIPFALLSGYMERWRSPHGFFWRYLGLKPAPQWSSRRRLEVMNFDVVEKGFAVPTIVASSPVTESQSVHSLKP